jgi:plasmid replication initiation protein
VRKHAGRQRAGWRFDFRHLYGKSASLSPFKRFAFELRDLARRQPLPGYRLGVERDRTGHELLVFARSHLPTAACGQPVEAVVPSGTPKPVPSGTAPACHQEPGATFSDGIPDASKPPNLESNQEVSNESVVGDAASQCKTGSRAR